MIASTRSHRRRPPLPIRRALGGLAGVIIFIIGLSVYYWYAFSGWNGREPVNVVISSEDRIFVAAVRPESNRLVILQIPPNMIVNVGEGSWQARALWQFSLIERRLDSVEAAGWNLLEVPIDGVVRVPQWDGQAGHFPGIRSFISGDFLRSARGGTWSLPSVIRLVRFFSRLNPGQAVHVDLSGLPATRRIVDPGGAELLHLDADVISPMLSDWFRIDQIRLEELTVALVNASERAGAGSQLARRIQHVGIRTVLVENGEGSAQLSIRSPDLASSLTVKKLASWLRIPVTVSDFSERADILIVVK